MLARGRWRPLNYVRDSRNENLEVPLTSPTLSIAKGNFLELLRYDLFKGVRYSIDSVHRWRSIGQATRPEGRNTFTLYLNTFTNEAYFLLPADERYTTAEYVIMTRRPSLRPHRKYHWKPVGEARAVSETRQDLLHLSFDVLGASDLFMSLVPSKPSYESQVVQTLKSVLAS